MVTGPCANRRRDAGLLVNAADPGDVATDRNGHRGPGHVAEGAVAPTRLVLPPAGGPTGECFNATDAIPC